MQKTKKYTDYAIISGLSSRRGKRDFVSFVDQELEILLEDTPENRVYAMSEINSKKEIEISYILTLESDLIAVLADMENRWVAFDKNKLVNIGERIRYDITQLENKIYDIIWEVFL